MHIVKKKVLGNPITKNILAQVIKKMGIYSPGQTMKMLNAMATSDCKRVLNACMPKSGSTYLAILLDELLGFERISLAFDCERNEQEIYWPSFFKSLDSDVLYGSQHVRASRPTLEAIKTFDISLLIQVRNIFDVVISIRDHYHQEGTISSMAFTETQYFTKLSEKEKIDFIIEMVLPWYFNFYVSWYHAEITRQIKVLWVPYEELIENRGAMLQKVSDFIGVTRTQRDIKNALDAAQQKRTRFNKGVSGRGQTMLSEHQRERIRYYTTFYSGVDFRLIGLGDT